MALAAGDMLYYDGSTWVNSRIVLTATTPPSDGLVLQLMDSGTGSMAYPLKLSHNLTSLAGSPTTGFGTGFQFLGLDNSGTPQTLEIGTFQCVESGISPNALSSYFSFSNVNGGTSQEVLRLKSTKAAVFLGQVLVGSSSAGNNPSAGLTLSAGAAAANSAPFKFTSGTNLTTPENGAMEYDGTNLYFTPSAATRKVVPMAPTAPSAYTVTNGSTDRALNVTGDTLAQGLAVLGTLIADLQAAKIIG